MASNISKRHAVGIMGGTFDPIHFGHLVAAEAARDAFSLDEVVFVPSGIPPHKNHRVISPAEDRYIMTLLAVADNPFFKVSRIELDREGYSYAIDTVRAFKEIYGTEVDIYFITGADAIMEIFTWKDFDRLLGECHFIAATRPGFHFQEVETFPDEYLKKIMFMEVPALSISSTDIRQRVKEGRSIKYLLPEAVEYYVHKKKLY